MSSDSCIVATQANLKLCQVVLVVKPPSVKASKTPSLKRSILTQRQFLLADHLNIFVKVPYTSHIIDDNAI